MAAMSSAGVNPDEIFYSLSRDEIGLFISEDAKKISIDAREHVPKMTASTAQTKPKKSM